MSYMPLARACKETKRRNPTPPDRPTTPPGALPGPEDLTPGSQRRSADEDRRPSCCPHQRKGGRPAPGRMWHLSEANAPAPQRGKPGAAPKSREAHLPKSREAAWGGPGPDADAGPPTCVSDDESDRRSKSPACIERAQHDAVPQTPPPPPPPVRAGSPASRVAASYKRLAALRVNDDDPPPSAAGALAGRRVRPAARGPQIPRERAKTRKHAAGLAPARAPGA